MEENKKIDEKALDEFKEAVKEKVKGENELTEDEVKVLEKILAESKLPVKIKDEEFNMGERELDIRGLSRANRDQIIFRMAGVLPNVYLRQILTSLVDISRLLMLVLKKLGSENINDEIDDLMKELKEQLLKN